MASAHSHIRRVTGKRAVVLLALALWLPLALTALAEEAAPAPAPEPAPAPAPQPAPEPEKIYTARELESEIYGVSNIETTQLLTTLAAMGYKTGAPTAELHLKDLPWVYALPDAASTTVVAREQGTLEATTDYSPRQRLMIFYHPSQMEELAKLKRELNEELDVPSRMVLIEALFIELSEEAARELGFQYDASGPHWTASFETNATTGKTALEVVGQRLYEGVTANARKFEATLKAIIDENRGDVLSSPSVLTLDNRQARISVTQDLPIITSTTVTGGTTSLSVTFTQAGITLNIKPRISKDGSWVALQVQTEVSEAPLADYIEINGQKVAPVISRRKVEAIARIKNNTPFIIGGLIRDEKTNTVSRIPLISRIPILGNLFQVRSDTHEKREVIIVLTPRVIETESANRQILPKDSGMFDIHGTVLFPESYRLKGEDVFNLEFLAQIEQVQSMYRQALEFLATHPEYRGAPPFDAIERGQVPGEESLVVRMLYEITKDKLKLDERVAADRLIYFAPDPGKPAGFRVTFLRDTLEKLAGRKSVRDYLEKDYPKNVLVLRYELHPDVVADRTSLVPVASVETPLAQSRADADKLVQEYSKLEGYGRTHAAILIADQKDLDRLQAAVAMREVIEVNDLAAILSLKNFQVGRRIVVPEIDPTGQRVFLIDHTVADLFFQSDYYYAAFQDEFLAYYKGIREILDKYQK